MSKAFIDDQRGQVAIMMGVFIIPIIAAIGFSIDYSRNYQVKQMTANATDAALIAVGRLPFNTDIAVKRQVAYDTFVANISSELISRDQFSLITDGNLPTDIAHRNIAIVLNISPDNNEISISSVGAVKNYFMPVVDVTGSGKFDKTMLANTSTLNRNIRDLELVIALDVSGSMDFPANGGGTRIAAAQQAIRDFNEIIFPSDPGQVSDGQTSVGIVPWTFNVQLPADSVMNTVDFISDVDGGNRGKYPRPFACTPTATSESPRYWELYDSNRTPSYERWWDAADIPAGLSPAPKVVTANNGIHKDGGQSLFSCPSSVPLDLSTSSNTINDFVENLSPNGGTDTNSGMFWARQMLDRDNDVWTDARAAFHAEDTRKVIVIMSDGTNFAMRSNRSRSPYNKSSALGNLVDYDNDNDETYGEVSLSQSQALVATKTELMNNVKYAKSMNGRFVAQCEAAKANDIIIYTIGFGLDQTTEAGRHATKMLEICAGTSGDDVGTYSYSALTKDELVNVFKRIAGGISSLQISQ